MNSEDQENIAPVLEESVPEVKALFNVEILSIIKEAQSQHGLRHNHYQRYREYCSRRLQRLRKVLNFKMGDKRKVIPKKITENVFSDARFIMMMVMTCERAWSTAMELKQDVESNPRKRHHMIERFRKAVKIANELVELCENSARVNARTKLECQAYCSYITGVLMFEQQSWVKARDNFQKTQTIYHKLAETLSKEEQRVYEGMVKEVNPNVRYCAYMIDDKSAMDDLVHLHSTNRQDPLLAVKLDSLIAESRERQASTMSELVWRKRTIRVKNNKVRLFLIGVKDFDTNLAQADDTDRDGKVELYDNALTECKDAIQVTKEDIKSDPHSKTGGQVSDLQFLHSYLSYLRLTKMIQRNLLVVEDLKTRAPELRLDEAGDAAPVVTTGKKQVRPVDFIRLYDSMLQNLNDLANLPGLEDDADMRNEIDVQQLAFKAYRCFYAAQSKTNDKCWTEAMALFDRVLVHARSAIDAFQLFTPVTPIMVDIDSLQNLVETIAFNQYRVHAAAVLSTTKLTSDEGAASSSIDRKKPLMERLEQYDETVKMSAKAPDASVMSSAFPPPFQPVPCKPVFFDLAQSQIDFPSLESKLKSSTQQRGGIGGLISNLWGGWGSKK